MKNLPYRYLMLKYFDEMDKRGSRGYVIYWVNTIHSGVQIKHGLEYAHSPLNNPQDPNFKFINEDYELWLRDAQEKTKSILEYDAKK